MLGHPWAIARPEHTRTTGTAGVEGAGGSAGPGCGTRGRWRGPSTPEPQAPPVWRAPVGRRAWLRRPWATAGPEHTRTTGTAGVEGAGGTGGPGCGVRGRRRGLAGLRDDAPSEARGADGERAGRRPRAHQAARPNSRIRRRPEHQRGHEHKYKHRHAKAGRNPSVPARPRCSVVISSARPPCRPCLSSRR